MSSLPGGSHRPGTTSRRTQMTSTLADPATRPDLHTGSDVLDVLIIGGGFSGLYALDRLRDLGFDVKVWDSAGGLGGVWWWNCYPGARTDSTGQIYQFSYKDLWKGYDFPELYPGHETVRDYFEYVDSQLDLTRDVVFDTFAEASTWDEDSRQWTVRSADGKVQKARQVIVATGFGAKPLYPSFEGLDSFAGECYHTARWPQGGEDMPARFAARYKAFAGFDFDFLPQNAADLSKEERDAIYESMWAAGGFEMWLGNFQDILVDEDANRTFYDFWRNKVLR